MRRWFLTLYLSASTKWLAGALWTNAEGGWKQDADHQIIYHWERDGLPDDLSSWELEVDTCPQSAWRVHKPSKQWVPLQVPLIFLSICCSGLTYTSTVDSYTEAELMWCTVHCLQNFSGTQQVYLSVHDWAQMAFTCTAAAVQESSNGLICFCQTSPWMTYGQVWGFQ